ncbi:MAG: hypothetical protein ING77_14060 [Rhodocyclaceae bacterium]|nr:hypothetical protein [Rhodocyclaceae bacterium]MCA3077122.1 hypothetical protein [Rhodocyclaceae bacterium]MCA3099943.1 hypothetical protein [Rhodocyclaceae bacterium]MCA3101022.1 hypothetical protein [Rhodocyclaceae bacterium]MCA3108285.1 hypothetical protein [Rhodocyclaceae bacterium]
MTDTMVRDMMAMPEIVGRSVAPRVISDAEYFVNDSAQPINRNLITDRLRLNLNRAARNRLVFVGRNHSQAVALERDLKRSGAVDVGTTGLTKAQAGADFRLGGRISSLDARNPRTGVMQRYKQIVFELFDLETGVIVWTNMSAVGATARFGRRTNGPSCQRSRLACATPGAGLVPVARRDRCRRPGPSFRPSPSGFERIESAKGPESAGRSATATGHARLALTMPMHCRAGQGLRLSPRCVRCSGSQVQPRPPVRGP